MSEQQPIVIKGKLAKQIYQRILKHDKGMSWYNEGTTKNPILRVEEW